MKGNLKKLIPAWLGVILVLPLVQFWLLDIRQVVGRSMEPTFYSGKVLVSFRWAYGLPLPFSPGYLFSWGMPNSGDLVIFRAPPGDHFSVKRVHSFDPQKSRVNLWGDNLDLSRDSRDFGSISVDEILGKVIF